MRNLDDNIGGGYGKSTMGIGNVNVRRIQVRKIGKIRLNKSLIYSDLSQRVQRI
jgi:hypothetical protein